MARILFAWELGGAYGHALACASLANTLALRGHHIAFAMREPAALDVAPEAGAHERYQAPRAANEGRMGDRPVSIPEILLGCGYRQQADLEQLVRAWGSILERARPDLVVADYAPTALLAARIAGIRRVTYANGFFTPPPLAPIPPYRYDEPVEASRLEAAEAAALAAVNATLAGAGVDPLARLADLFAADEQFLCTFPELDHYQDRPPSGYWGPRYRFDRGAALDWPKPGDKRIFVYVHTSMPLLDALIDTLAQTPHRVIAFIPGVDPARRARLASPSRLVAERPVRLDALMRDCDVVISHGSEIATGALLSGVPQLCFPGQYEQYLTSRRLEQVGSGAWVGPRAPPATLHGALATMLREPRFAAAAAAFRRRYAAFSPAEQRRRIAARIDDILSRS